MNTPNVGVISVVPSPYQRDLFRAIAKHVNLKVYYLEAAAPDSPWPEEPLAKYESILPGRWFSVSNARFHLVTQLPDFKDRSFLVLNTLTSSLAQWLMRFCSRENRLIFWAETLRPQKSFLRRMLQAQLAAPVKNTAAIAAIGTQAQKAYRMRFPNQICFNIPYYCDLTPFLQNPLNRPPNDGELTILFCGQMIARKGVDLLVTAFDRLIAKGYRARLLLVGRRADLDWALGHASPKARHLIDYQGFSDPKKLPELFSKAHLFVLPSRYDGWGVVVNQALGAGLPMICSNAVGAAHDLVQENRNGFRVATGNVDALASAMEKLLCAPQRFIEFSSVSRSMAHDWSPECGAQKWMKAFDHLKNIV